jgi:hypothetical protein
VTSRKQTYRCQLIIGTGGTRANELIGKVLQDKHWYRIREHKVELQWKVTRATRATDAISTCDGVWLSPLAKCARAWMVLQEAGHEAHEQLHLMARQLSPGAFTLTTSMRSNHPWIR